MSRQLITWGNKTYSVEDLIEEVSNEPIKNRSSNLGPLQRKEKDIRVQTKRQNKKRKSKLVQKGTYSPPKDITLNTRACQLLIDNQLINQGI